MKVSELEGAELDYWVAKAEGMDARFDKHDGRCRAAKTHQSTHPIFTPSSDWSQGGPIIERERIFIRPLYHATTGEDLGLWLAGKSKFYAVPNHWHQEGTTPLIASMRAYVAFKFGDEVEM